MSRLLIYWGRDHGLADLGLAADAASNLAASSAYVEIAPVVVVD